MIKQANKLYLNKILLNFPMIFRPIVKEVIDISKDHFISYNEYLNFLRALIVGEPSDVLKINHSHFPKILHRIKKEYRNDFFYLIAKSKEFIPRSHFMKFIENLNSKKIEFR